jgi:hypothetical protein
MPARRALIVEKDQDFAERLQRCFELLDLSVDHAVNRREAIESLKSAGTAIVFIAVERPTKSGFKLFTDAKRLLRNVPIVLGSSTVPMDELLMHQKLRLHADAYVDKRGLTDHEILETFNGLLQLGLDPAELSSMARRSRSTRAGSGKARKHVVLSDDGNSDATDDSSDDPLAVVDPDLVDLLDDVNESAATSIADERAKVEEAAAGEDHGFDEECDVEELRDEVLRLRRELEHARRSATSSPFSTDYLELSERAEAGERGKARMRREINARARQVEALRSKLLQVAGRLLQAERSRDLLQDRLRELEARIGPLDEELRVARGRLDELNQRLAQENERRLAAEKERASEITSLENRLASESRRATEAERHHEAAIAEVLEKARRDLDEQRRQLEREYEAASEARAEAGRQELANAIEAKQRAWQKEIDALRQRHERELEVRREEHRKHLTELHNAMDETLLRKEREMQQARADAEAGAEAQRQRASEFETRVSDLREEHAQALASKEAEAAERLERSRREHETALTALRAEHEKQLNQLTASYERTLEERDRQHQETLEQSVSEARQGQGREADERLTELERVEIDHRKSIGELEQRHREQIDLIEKLHQDELERERAKHRRESELMREEQQAAIAGLEEQVRAEQQQAAAARQAEWQAQLDEMRQEQARTLAAEREEMQVIIDALETVKGVDRAEPIPDEALAEPAAATDDAPLRNSALLRQIAEEMDRLDAPSPDAGETVDTRDPAADR